MLLIKKLFLLIAISFLNSANAFAFPEHFFGDTKEIVKIEECSKDKFFSMRTLQLKSDGKWQMESPSTSYSGKYKEIISGEKLSLTLSKDSKARLYDYIGKSGKSLCKKIKGKILSPKIKKFILQHDDESGTMKVILLVKYQATKGNSTRKGKYKITGDIAYSTKPNQVVIQGIVSDDPVEGATVNVMSLPNKEVLATTVTDDTGAYSTPPIKDAWLSNGYYITASGGISQGKPFVGEMRAVYGSDSDYDSSHVTLLTTAVTKAAESNTSDLKQLPVAAQEVSETAVSQGQLPTQWTDVDVATAYSLDENGQILRLGVDGFTNELAYQFNFNPSLQQAGTYCEARSSDERVCSTHIGYSGGTLRDQTGPYSGNIIAEIPSPLSFGCEYNVNALINEKDQSVSVWTQITSENISTTPPCAVIQFSDEIVIYLPPFTGEAPDIEGAPKHVKMKASRTKEAGIAPGFFVTDKEIHRVKNPIHRTKSTSNRTVTVERKYGANLSRKTDTNSKHPDAASVLFIHGFLLSTDDYSDFDGDNFFEGEKFNGGDGTWGHLPHLVSKLRITTDPNIERFEPYNFQWRTDASFYVVAQELAKAIRYAYKQSGNQKVHIVAHSFGGILARVTLQGLYEGSSVDNWSDMVATLTTVGTPHSGISLNDANVWDISLPAGWGTILPHWGCKQVSCYQTGLPSSIGEWMKTSSNLGTNTIPGYLIADLENNRSKLPDGLIFQALIGQVFRGVTGSSGITIGREFNDGDRLISFYGQRLIPENSASSPRTTLSYEADFGGATATERILGLDPKVAGFPKDRVYQTSNYAKKEAFSGYAHTRFTNHLCALVPLCDELTLKSTDISELEVNVPDDCNDPDTCKHDTWVNIRELLLSMHGGTASPNFETKTGPAVDDPGTPPPDPETPAGYLEFGEGNPGIEDDEIFISSSQENPLFSTHVWFALDPKPLVGTINDGVTITVITKRPVQDAFAQIYYEFGYLGTQCLVQIHDNDVVRPYKLTAEATFYSHNVLSSVTETTRQGYSTGGTSITSLLGCSRAEVSGMFLNRIVFLRFGQDPVELDAAILDSGLVKRFVPPI